MATATGRYAVLADMINRFMAIGESLTFIEVGTYNGYRAVKLCSDWMRRTSKPINYVGFDLFEDMTRDVNTKELSKSTLPPSLEAVDRLFQQAKVPHTLIKGDTKITIPKFVAESNFNLRDPRLIFIDGGHSLETVASDWEALSKLAGTYTVFIFDDYYENKEGFGCRETITKIQQDPKWNVNLLNPVDHVESSGLQIRMVQVMLRQLLDSPTEAQAA